MVGKTRMCWRLSQPGGVAKKKHKKPVTTEDRRKVYAALDRRRFGIERKDWMSFDDILKVCKINEGLF